MNRSRSGYIFIVLCAVIFSTMEVMLKTVHGVFAPMQITCLRFLVGGVLLIPFAMRSIRKKNAVLTRKDLGFFACAGFLCVVIAMSLYQMSVTYTRASIVAVIFSCNPIFVTVLAHFLLHEEIHKNHIIALILELTAALIIIDPIHASLDPTGALLAILSAAMFSFYSVFGKKRTPRFGGIAVTCLSFLFGATELVALLLFGRTAAGASLYGALGLKIFIDVPLFENIPLSALPALLYICCINSAAGYYFNKRQMCYDIVDGKADTNVLIVPTLKTYDDVQIEDVVAKRRWKMEPLDGYDNLVGAAEYLRIDRAAGTVTIEQHDDLDGTWTAIHTETEPTTIQLSDLSEKDVDGCFFRAILKYADQHADKLLARTEAKIADGDE